MKRYELLYIIAPTLSPDEAKETAFRYRDMVLAAGGEVERLEDMGVRKLAYEIAGHVEGRYVLMVFLAPPDIPKALGEQMRIDERVVRHLCIVETRRVRRAAQAAVLEAEATAATPAGQSTTDEEQVTAEPTEASDSRVSEIGHEEEEAEAGRFADQQESNHVPGEEAEGTA